MRAGIEEGNGIDPIGRSLPFGAEVRKVETFHDRVEPAPLLSFLGEILPDPEKPFGQILGTGEGELRLRQGSHLRLHGGDRLLELGPFGHLSLRPLPHGFRSVLGRHRGGHAVSDRDFASRADDRRELIGTLRTEREETTFRHSPRPMRKRNHGVVPEIVDHASRVQAEIEDLDGSIPLRVDSIRGRPARIGPRFHFLSHVEQGKRLVLRGHGLGGDHGSVRRSDEVELTIDLPIGFDHGTVLGHAPEGIQDVRRTEQDGVSVSPSLEEFDRIGVRRVRHGPVDRGEEALARVGALLVEIGFDRRLHCDYLERDWGPIATPVTLSPILSYPRPSGCRKTRKNTEGENSPPVGVSHLEPRGPSR